MSASQSPGSHSDVTKDGHSFGNTNKKPRQNKNYTFLQVRGRGMDAMKP